MGAGHPAPTRVGPPRDASEHQEEAWGASAYLGDTQGMWYHGSQGPGQAFCGRAAFMPWQTCSELSSVQTLGGDKPPATEEVVLTPARRPPCPSTGPLGSGARGGLGALGAGQGSRRRTALPCPCGLSSPPCRGSTFHTSFPGIVSSVITAPDAETSQGMWKCPGRKVRPSLWPPASGRERGPQPSPAAPGDSPEDAQERVTLPSPLWLPPALCALPREVLPQG